MAYRFEVAVLVLVGLTKKRFGHYAILKILSLKSPSKYKPNVGTPRSGVGRKPIISHHEDLQ